MKTNLSDKYTISLQTKRVAHPYYGPHEIGTHFDNIAGDDYIVITPAQAGAFETVLERQGARNLKSVSLEFGRDPALMLTFNHITIGIESDGYAHS